MTEVDPFTIAELKIIKICRDKGLKIVDFVNSRDPQPEVVAKGDLPEWQVRPSAFLFKLGGRSCQTDVQKDYDMLMNTGSLRLSEFFNSGQFTMLKLLHWLKYNAFNDVQYKGRTFVNDVEVLSGQSGIADPTTNRNIKGWVALAVVRLHMSFPAGDLEL